MMVAAVARVAERARDQAILYVVLGEDAPTERTGQAEIRFVAYQKDPSAVARYYQAADVYLHAARADTFPSSVIEAMACATPVVATAVGGIPEQVDDAQTGFLVRPGDAEALATRLSQVLSDDNLKCRMGMQAAEVARRRFDLHLQVNSYLEWYQEIIQAGSLAGKRTAQACVAQL